MARFTTRVQLNGNPSEDKFTDLHWAMKRKGFKRFITGSDGKTYHMPHAEYNRISDAPINQVRDDAWEAAKSVWNDVEVLVTKGTRSWNGLKEATAAEVAAG